MAYTRAYPWQVLTRTAGLMLSFRLPLTVDPQRLQDDTNRVLERFAAAAHFRQDHHDGGWSAIGLIAPGGDYRELRQHAGESYEKTAALKDAPYIEALLDGLPYEKHRVRLMRLAKGANIFWHFDRNQHMDGGRARLHVPVFTNPDVAFQISHESMRWGIGELWYGDFSFPHRLHNAGVEDRVHLVMDLTIDESVADMIPRRMTREKARRARLRRWAQYLCGRYTAYAPYMPDRFRAGIGRGPRMEEAG